MDSYVLLRPRYVVRPVSDHPEVSQNLRLFYVSRLPHTQGVRRGREEPSDRLLPVFYQFRTGCFRDSWFDPFRVTSRYDLSPFPLNQTSEANPNFKSDGIPRPSFR